MSAAPVVFDHVSKKYRMGQWHTSFRDLIPALAKRMVSRRPPPEALHTQEFWAVDDVSFEVAQGEAFGIIGRNGAGKSTTLKLLTRILRPTKGHCHVRGRVGALIEVAAGFHPDLTGRENIYLQGAVMGMKRAEIARHLDEIVEFAGVADFIDTQVKRYSSGMNARLGFAIAAHLNPDVLIIDEVLSVGDLAFQDKCVRRMQEFKRQGVTIVFVSHNLPAVADLCDRALFLDRRAVFIGPSQDTLRAYVESTAQVTAAEATELTLASAELTGVSPGEAVRPGQQLAIRLRVTVNEPLRDVTVGFILYRSSDNLVVYDSHFAAADVGLITDGERGDTCVDFQFTANLTRGQYHIEFFAMHNPTQYWLSRLSPAVMFTVQETVTSRGVADIEMRAGVPTLATR
jgi:lipopolysaccharide transport system ATP-binding protein